jgi:hypothetical protein
MDKRGKARERVGPVAATVDTCRCQGCQGLRERHKKDIVLLRFYAANLLKRGWAGVADDAEKRYQAGHASWYAAARESGLRLAQGMAQPVPNPQAELASGPPA